MANRTPAGLPPADLPSVIGWLSKQIGDVRADVRRLEAGQGRTLPDDFRFHISEDGSQVTIEQVSTGDVVTLANPVAPLVRSVDGEIGAVELPGFGDPADPDVPALRTLGTGPFEAAAGNDPRFSSGGPPSGAAGGALAGTYPNPTLAAAADQSMLGNFSGAPAPPTPQTKAAIKAFLAIVPGDITGLGGAALLNVGSTIGTVAAGDDPRFSAAAGPAGGVLSGTYPNPAIAAGAALGTPSSLVLTNATALPLTTGVTGTLPVGFGGTGVTSSTGTGSNVLSASPAFTGAPTGPTQSAGDNSTRLATTAYADSAVAAAVTGLLHMRGSTDCSVNPNYPVAVVGDAYVVTVAGKIGGSSGVAVDVGDVYFATAANGGGTQGAVGASWDVLEHNLAGALLSANNLSDVANTATALANLGGVPITRTVNGHALSSNITVTAADVGAPSGSGTSTGSNTGDQDLTPYAPKASPAFTGSPTAPTQAAGDNSTKLATTAYTDLAAAHKVDLIQGKQGIYLAPTGTVLRTAGDLVASSTYDAATNHLADLNIFTGVYTDNATTLTNGVGTEGDIYQVTTAGTQFGHTFAVGEFITYADGVWRWSAAPPTRGVLVEPNYTIGPDIAFGPHPAPATYWPGTTSNLGPAGFIQNVGQVVMGSAATNATGPGMGVGFQNIMVYGNDPAVAGTKLTTAFGYVNETWLTARSQYVQSRNEFDTHSGAVEGGFWDGQMMAADTTGLLDGGMDRAYNDRGFDLMGYTAAAWASPGSAARKRSGYMVQDVRSIAYGGAAGEGGIATTYISGGDINVGGALFVAGTGIITVTDTSVAQRTVTGCTTSATSDPTVVYVTTTDRQFTENDRGRQIVISGAFTGSPMTGTVIENITSRQIVVRFASTGPAAGSSRTAVIGKSTGTLTLVTGDGTNQTGYSKVTFTGISGNTFTGCQLIRCPAGDGSTTRTAIAKNGAIVSTGGIIHQQVGLLIPPLLSGVSNIPILVGFPEEPLLTVTQDGDLQVTDRDAANGMARIFVGPNSGFPLTAFQIFDNTTDTYPVVALSRYTGFGNPGLFLAPVNGLPDVAVVRNGTGSLYLNATSVSAAGTLAAVGAVSSGSSFVATGAATFSFLQLVRDDGAALPAADELLGLVQFRGNSTTGGVISTGSAIRSYASALWTGSSSPARLTLETTPTGSLTPLVRHIIDTDGTLYFGTSTSSAIKITNAGTASLGATSLGNGVNAGTEVARITSTATNDDPVEVVTQYRGTSSGVTTATLATIAVPTSTAIALWIMVVGRRTDTTEQVAAFTIAATGRNVGGAADVAQTAVHTGNLNGTTWTCVLDANSSNLRIRVTGASGSVITWHATVRTYTVST